MTARRLLLRLFAPAISALTLLLPVAGNASAPPVQPATPQVHTSVIGFGKLPLSFEANQGQTDPQVKFIARGRGYTLFLTPTESVMVLQQREASAREKDPLATTAPTALPEPAMLKQAVLRMKLEGANPSPAIDGMEQLSGIVNYFIGNDPKKWRTNIPTYQKVEYKSVYPGIDLAYYGNQGKLEYDFIVAPGADPNQIKLAFEGASDIRVADSGDLILKTEGGELRLRKPLVYQHDDRDHKHLIASNYVLLASGAKSSMPVLSISDQPSAISFSVGIQVAAYDQNRPLVIDPTLSTYLGGSDFDAGYGIAVDVAGQTYVTGETSSANFPVIAGAFQPGLSGDSDVFVTTLDPTGLGLVYSTYLGGSGGGEGGYSIAVDAAGSAYVTGYTQSADFPITGGAFDPVYNIGAGGSGTGFEAFVTKLNPTGSGLLYSTYLGGDSGEIGRGIAVDAAGNAYVAGEGASNNFPTTPGAFDGGPGAFVTKLNPTGSAPLVYSAHLGSGSPTGIGVDATGHAYVTGYTFGAGIPVTADAFQPEFGGGEADGFMTKLNPTGSDLVYSTYLGGSSTDQSYGIAVDAAGNSYVTGETDSGNFPMTTGAFQPTFGGGFRDAFVAKIQFAIVVTIDIKPGSFPNSINLGSSGSVPVAILSTATFDATTVDPVTVTLASAPVKLKGKGTPMASFQDVNGDSRLDLVVHVDTQAFVLNASDTEAVLEGQISGGMAIRGSDSIRVVP